MSSISLRVPRPAVILGASVLATALLAALTTAAAGAPRPAQAQAAGRGYQVLVTAGPGAPQHVSLRPVTARPPGQQGPAPLAMLRLGGQDLTVPLPAGATHAPRSFAVTAVTHTGHGSASAPTRTITVDGTGLTGQPANGQVLLGNVANANAPGTGFTSFTNGTATYHVPPGTYWVVAVFPQVNGHTLTSLRLDVLPQFTVSRSTTVHAKATAATSEVTMATPRPATMRGESLTIVRAAPGAPPSAFSSKVSSLEEEVTGASLWVNPVSQAPSYGSLHVFTSAQLTSPAEQQPPYAYTLNFPSPPGTIGPQHFTAAASGLATVPESYVQDQRTVAAWISLGGTRYQLATSFVGGAVFPLAAPGRQVQYLSASPPMLWRSLYSEYRTIQAGQSPGGQTSAMQLLHPGQQPPQTWNAYPLHPASNVSLPGNPGVVRSSADRAGNTLNLDVTPFTDNQPGHLGAGLVIPFPGKTSQVSGRYAVYQDGTKIASGNAVKATGGFGDVQVHAALSGKPSVIRFVLTASRASAQYRQSATSHDVWTFHTRPAPGATVPVPWLCDFRAVLHDQRCAVQPMVTLGYQVTGLSLGGTTQPGRQSVLITAGHIQLAPRLPVRRATVQISMNGGKTWQPATVRSLGTGRFRATFTAAAGAAVSLRVTATDSAGNSLAETLPDAYQTAS